MLLGVVTAMLLLDTSHKANTKNAPDGTVVRLLKHTSGTQHVHTVGNVLQRTAAPFLSGPQLKKFKIHTLIHQTANYAHAFWFEVTGTSTSKLPPGRMFSYLAAVHDDTGCFHVGRTVNMARGNGRDLMGFETPAFPTTSRTLHVVLHRGAHAIPVLETTNASTFLAAFDVPNPEYLGDSRWQAQNLPIHIQEDGLDFALKAFVRLPDAPIMEIDSDLLQPNGSTNQWLLRGLQVVNEHGHHVCFQMFYLAPDPLGLTARFHGACSTNNPLKLKFEFADLASPTNAIRKKVVELIVRPQGATVSP